MTQAICFSCGEDKLTGPLTQCAACEISPSTDDELTLSLALSDHLATASQLVHFAHEIKNHLRLSIPQALLDQAATAMKDPQIRALMKNDSKNRLSSNHSSKPIMSDDSSSNVSGTNGVQFRGRRSVDKTDMDSVPFAVLGATIRDDRKRIMDLAEEKSLELDSEICQKARSDLINPRTRLAAEMAWLPGVSPRRAKELMLLLKQDPLEVSSQVACQTWLMRI